MISSAPGTVDTVPLWTQDSDPTFLLPAEFEPKVWRAGDLLAIRTKEPEGWHLSISHPTRLPTWDEIKDARYRFLPDRITVAQLLPPRKEWTNIHDFCLHLWEIAPR